MSPWLYGPSLSAMHNLKVDKAANISCDSAAIGNLNQLGLPGQSHNVPNAAPSPRRRKSNAWLGRQFFQSMAVSIRNSWLGNAFQRVESGLKRKDAWHQLIEQVEARETHRWLCLTMHILYKHRGWTNCAPGEDYNHTDSTL